MKTAEEKAIAFVRELQEELISYNHSGFYIINEVLGVAHKSFMRGYNEAMRCQSSPKIKQLEWEELSREVIEADYEYPPEIVFKAATPFMYYTIHKSFTNTFEVNGDPEIYSSIDEAKSAAQADFEKRVKECLE